MASAARLFRSSWFWLAAFLAWVGTLWWLSSSARSMPVPLRFSESDKIIHFGFFFGGAGLLSAFLYCRAPENPKWHLILQITVLVITLIGSLDEFHQSFVPQRSGNDALDLTADFCGAIAGALVFRKVHRVLA